MANKKITDLTSLTAPAATDVLPIIDQSESAAADKNKKIAYSVLLTNVPAGSVSTPSIAFTGDPNTGIAANGADGIQLVTGGAPRLLVADTGITIPGSLEVQGTVTTIDTTNLTVKDKNIEIAKGNGNDAAVDGAGITIDSTDGDKTWNWVDSTDAWTSSEHIDLASGKVLKVAGTQVLSATQYTGNAATASAVTNITVAAESTDTSCSILFTTAASGSLPPKTATSLTFNSNTGALTATSFVGALTGNVTGNASGSSGSCTGNAATSTEATNVTVSANNSTDETVYPLFVDGATGTQGAETDTGLSYNPSSGNLTSTVFTGNLTGNVTGNTSGSSGSCTGNAATATALATARTIAGVSFDGTANISLNNNAITNGAGYITATLTQEQVEDYVGGMVTGNTETGITVTYQDADGTLDFVVGTLNQDTTGNAATATALETARTIGGVSFDGTANINLPGVNATGDQDTTGNATTATTATTATNFTVSANNSTDETVYPVFVDGATGGQGGETDTGLTYNPSSGLLTSTSFAGNLTGNVTGNCSGTAATVTGAAQSNITSVGTLSSLASGAITTTDNLSVDNAKEVRFYEADSNGSAYVGIKGATDKGSEASYTVSLPADAPTANQILKADASTPTNLTWATDSGGIPDTGGSFTGKVTHNYTSSIRVPVGTTAQRDGSPSNGDFRYNSTTSKFEGYNSGWGEIGGGATGSADLLDIASSSGTGGGGSTFDGSRYRFKLVTKGTSDAVTPVNAEILRVSINGVMQQPNDGSGQGDMTEGYVVSGTDIIFDSAPPSGASYFIINMGTQVAVGNATTVTVADESSDTSCNVLFTTAATGDLAPKSGTNLTFNSSSGALTATSFVGALTGNVTGNASGSAGSCTGNAATATTSGHVTVTDNESTNENNLIPFVEDAGTSTGSHGLEMDGDFHYNPSTGTVTATAFAGSGANLTGIASTSLDGCGYQNDQTISSGTYTIAANKGMHSVGPITNNGTVTVNGTWLIS